MLAIFLWSYSVPSAQKLGAEWGRQYLCFFFLIEKNAFRLIHLFFLRKLPFLHCISSASELLPSRDTAPWCAVMLRCSCLVSHSSPPKTKRAGEITKAALHEPPLTMAFHPTPVHHLNMASGRFMFITVKAANQIGWDYKELKAALWGVLRNTHLYLLWTWALLLNIAAYLEGIKTNK